MIHEHEWMVGKFSGVAEHDHGLREEPHTHKWRLEVEYSSVSPERVIPVCDSPPIYGGDK